MNYHGTKCPQIHCGKGTKQVGQITAHERGTLVTVCCCANAAGQALPPVIIFPRVNFKDYMPEGAPASTLGLATATGWMNAELFPQVLAHLSNILGAPRTNMHFSLWITMTTIVPWR